MTDFEKLLKLTFGDIITWREGSQEVSGPVHGFCLTTHDMIRAQCDRHLVIWVNVEHFSARNMGNRREW